MEEYALFCYTNFRKSPMPSKNNSKLKKAILGFKPGLLSQNAVALSLAPPWAIFLSLH